ncbi:hypothetical protein J2X31_001001 [Flavobacterium arsenatis]|uniref:Uncharacterized protein n=1 Tax=Flavobacterium arsenatis TaxID=1484332 RepID=A0ABU1TMA8_9FLAO|nr:hypothetical protein [Flavobacterium arsenatis]
MFSRYVLNMIQLILLIFDDYISAKENKKKGNELKVFQKLQTDTEKLRISLYPD